MKARSCLAMCTFFAWTATALAQDTAPILRLEAGGPTGNVTSLAFSPDGKTLYAGGFDKVVRVWRLNEGTHKFELDPITSFRVPIHPGTQGAINALALSADGAWLAVGGLGIVRGGAGFHETGKLWPITGITPEMRLDQGVIYVFHTRKREVRALRGHRGPIRALSFLAETGKGPLLLASAALGWENERALGEVKLWDVGKAEVLGQLSLPTTQRRPGLAIMTGGDRPRVAIAWVDDPERKAARGTGVLRLWDVHANRVQEVEDGIENIALTMLPERKMLLLSGSFARNKGVVQAWQLGPNGLAKRQRFEPEPPEGWLYFPRSLGAFAARPGAAVDHVAAVSRLLQKGNETVIVELFDAGAEAFGKSKASFALWKQSKIEPLVASSPGGRHLAAAGNPEHSIWVFNIDRVLAGQPGLQVLDSVGTLFRRVAFMRQGDGKALGLLLGEDAPDRDIVFDFYAGKISDAAGWQKASAKTAGWSARISSEKDEVRSVQLVKDGNADGEAMAMPAGCQLTAYAIVPPRGPAKMPLFVAALYMVNEGETMLEVYDGATGAKLRRFDGHLAPIRALAISDDATLLASASEDQTAAVWSLTDFGEILGKFGSLPGVAVKKEGKRVIVAQVDAGSPAAKKLMPGQIIAAVQKDGTELKPLAEPFELYGAFWRSKPGTKLTLKIEDANDVEAEVGQGVDVRKPLLSLFVTRPDADKKRDWLGWNATGPFDSSRQAVEKNLGWHFNLAQGKEPAQFAQIDQYRKKFFKEGILKHLVDQASLARGLEAWTKEKTPPQTRRPAPRILEGLGAVRTAEGELLFRQAKSELSFAIDNYEPRPGDTVRWQKDDGPAAAFDAPEGNVWSVPLDKIFTKPGKHKVRLTVRMPEMDLPAVEYSREVMVRLQHAPPEIKAAELNVTAEQKEFPLLATISSIHEGQKVDVEVVHKAGKKTVAEEKRAALSLDRPFELKKVLQLKEGENLVRITARNIDPLPGRADDETTTLTMRIDFDPRAPTLVLEKILPLDKGGEPEESSPIKPGQRVDVASPRIRIVGNVKFDKVLPAPTYDLGPGSERVKIAVKEAAKQYALAVDIQLAPGLQQVRFFAGGGPAAETSQVVEVVYRPALPRIVVTEPAPNAVLRETADKNTRTIMLEGKLIAPANPSPMPFELKLRALVNGKAMGKATLDGDSVKVEGLELHPGNNVIQLQAFSPWSIEPAQAETQVRYVRPPKIVALRSELVGKLPFVNLSAEVSSPLEPLPESIVVDVNGKRQKFARQKITKGAGRLWKVDISEVPLDADENKEVNKNDVQVWLANAEDRVQKPQAVEVVYNTPPPPRPEILLEPSAVTLQEPEVRLKFQVHSQKPLKRLEVSLGGKTLYQADPGKLEARDKGVYEVDTGMLTIDWGYHQLLVEAVNDGGAARKPFIASVPSWPVRVDIDRLEVEGVKTTNATPTLSPGGKLTFPRISAGKATLVGKIRWSSRDDKPMQGAHHLMVYVCGYKQLAARLSPFVRGERVRTFEVPLTLPFAENHVELVLPDGVQDAGNRTQFDIACAHPERGQHLHVVIVAPEERNEKELRNHFMKALMANPAGKDLATNGAFAKVQFHAFTDYVELLPIMTRLHQLGRDLKSRAANRHPNDVVLVYYWGKQTPVRNDAYFWTSETESAAQVRGTGLALRNLEKNFFEQYPGAQVLVLDLFESKQPDGADGSRYALLCHCGAKKALGTGRFPLLAELGRDRPDCLWLCEDLAPAIGKSLSNYHHQLPANLKIHWHTPTMTGGGGSSGR